MAVPGQRDSPPAETTTCSGQGAQQCRLFQSSGSVAFKIKCDPDPERAAFENVFPFFLTDVPKILFARQKMCYGAKQI